MEETPLAGRRKILNVSGMGIRPSGSLTLGPLMTPNDAVCADVGRPTAKTLVENEENTSWADRQSPGYPSD